METTLEVRWFVRGIPPSVVQRWFRVECLGKYIERTETRKDWYVYPEKNLVDKLNRLLVCKLQPKEINLKLRQDNLELKLEQSKLGSHNFGRVKNLYTCQGKVQQWLKFGESELHNFGIYRSMLNKTKAIAVDKKRDQKIYRNVKSELTCLQVNQEPWWTIAFEMNQKYDKQQEYNCFKQVIETFCQTYYGPKLSADNSYGYSRWLLKFAPIPILSY